MSETATDVVWLTQEAYDNLEAELNELRTVGREEVSARIAAAREEGDLSENGGYHAAREELGKIDGRIAQLQDMLKRAQVGETPPDDGVVEPGMVVTYRFEGDGEDETEKFLLGSREMKGEGDTLEVYSPQSPLGQAIDGRRRGETVSYQAPNGKTIKVEIVDAVPYDG